MFQLGEDIKIIGKKESPVCTLKRFINTVIDK